MSLVEVREKIRPLISAKEREKRRQEELQALYTSANNFLNDKPEYVTGVGNGIAKVEYIRVGENNYHVAITTALLSNHTFLVPENPPKIKIAVKKYYRGEEADQQEVATYYTLSRDNDGTFDFKGGPLPTVPEKSKIMTLWSRERQQRKGLQQVLNAVTDAERYSPPIRPANYRWSSLRTAHYPKS